MLAFKGCLDKHCSTLIIECNQLLGSYSSSKLVGGIWISRESKHTNAGEEDKTEDKLIACEYIY